jgi:hypothetical protein
MKEVFSRKEVDQIIVNPAQRRVDLRWVDKATPSRWIEMPAEFRRFLQSVDPSTQREFQLPLVPTDGILAKVPSGEIAVRAFGSLYLLPGSEIAAFAQQCVHDVRSHSSSDTMSVALAVLDIIGQHLLSGRAPTDGEIVKASVRRYDRITGHLQLSKRLEDLIDIGSFSRLLIGTNWKAFDTWAWRRDIE